MSENGVIGVQSMVCCITRSSRDSDNHELEIESLRDIIEQYKRSVQSLVDEIELKGLREKECERRVNTERE